MKAFIEGLFLCIGVGMFYLAASTADHGNIGVALVLFACGFCFLALMLAMTFER